MTQNDPRFRPVPPITQQDTRPSAPANPATPAASSAPSPTAPPASGSIGNNVRLSSLNQQAPDSDVTQTTRRRQPVSPSEAHVLVVEDNVPNFVLIARLLAYMDIQRCEWKMSGWEVVQFAETLSRIDLILMDIRLPYEDGFQALERLRQHPRLRDTIICAVTAEASEDQLRRAQQAGFDGFIGKPLDPDRFPLQVERLLQGEQVWEWR